MKSFHSRSGAVLVAAMLLSGCVREAEIAMPGDLRASLQRIELSGMSGWQDGGFRLGESEGRFTRRASQERHADGGIRNQGGGSFVVAGADVGARLAGDCRFDEEALDLGAIVVTTEHLSYACAFQRDFEPAVGRLILREVPATSGPLSGRTRAGEIRYRDMRIQFRAIHDMEGGRLPSGTPLGYSFEAGGRQIGAVDLNGAGKTIYAPHSGIAREAVLAASLALAIFWDPGE